MKILKYILLALCMTTAVTVDAKSVKVPHVYMFGFSASFKDSIVYLTDIQDVQNVWLDQKTRFLLGRDNYSYQLKSYITEQAHAADRVCMVMFAESKKKAERLYLKLRKKYTTPGKKKKGQQAALPYDVRYITLQEFKFEPIDMSEE